MPLPLLAALPFIGGAAKFGSNIGQGIANRKQSMRNIQAQHEHNKELAEYQYSKNLEMWERQNEYNSPVEQMRRYQEAGLNPRLVYGSPASSGNATTMPQYSQQATDMSKKLPVQIGDIAGGIDTYQNVLQRQADHTLRDNQGKTEYYKQLTAYRQDFILSQKEYKLYKSYGEYDGMQMKYSDAFWLESFDQLRAERAKRGISIKQQQTDLRIRQLEETGRQIQNELQEVIRDMAKNGYTLQDQWELRQMYIHAGKAGVPIGGAYMAMQKLLPYSAVKSITKGLPKPGAKNAAKYFKQGKPGTFNREVHEAINNAAKGRRR